MAFYNEMLSGIGHIFKAPFVDLSALWVITPLVVFWIILELYFDTHKKEELGWNTALGNGISMFWITVQLMKYLFESSAQRFTWPKFAIILAILLYGIFVSYISFSHKFSSKITYALSSPTPVYFFSGTAVLWAYGSLQISLWVLIDLFILFGILLLIVFILRKILPESEKDSDSDDSSSFDSGKSDS